MLMRMKTLLGNASELKKTLQLASIHWMFLFLIFLSDVIKLKDISKAYSDMLAVNHVSFGLESNSCFGLLGYLPLA